jgi:hypothetical protein
MVDVFKPSRKRHLLLVVFTIVSIITTTLSAPLKWYHICGMSLTEGPVEDRGFAVHQDAMPWLVSYYYDLSTQQHAIRLTLRDFAMLGTVSIQECMKKTDGDVHRDGFLCDALCTMVTSLSSISSRSLVNHWLLWC